MTPVCAYFSPTMMVQDHRKRTSYLRDAYLLDVYVKTIRNRLIVYIGNLSFPFILFCFLWYY